MTIDHICFAVQEIEKGIENWTITFGYRQMTEVVVNTRQQVKVVFLEKKDSLIIKLIEPLETNTSVLNFVKHGGGFHHLCFKCENMEKEIQDLNSKGVMTLVPPQPGEAFENEEIAFLLTRFGINVELIETEKKAARIITGKKKLFSWF
jgi:methylmalonyl-CoA/ethylmalonyl-CoA epimerase